MRRVSGGAGGLGSHQPQGKVGVPVQSSAGVPTPSPAASQGGVGSAPALFRTPERFTPLHPEGAETSRSEPK